MRYYHYIDGDLCMSRFGLEAAIHFGSPIISPLDNITEGEFYGIGITLFIFEFHLGVIAMI